MSTTKTSTIVTNNPYMIGLLKDDGSSPGTGPEIRQALEQGIPGNLLPHARRLRSQRRPGLERERRRRCNSQGLRRLAGGLRHQVRRDDERRRRQHGRADQQCRRQPRHPPLSQQRQRLGRQLQRSAPRSGTTAPTTPSAATAT